MYYLEMRILNKKYFKIFAMISLTLMSLFFCACSNKKDKSPEITEVLEEEQPQNIRPHWQNTAEKICIVFGYGYNSEDFTKPEIEHLEEFFGLSDGTENSGLIIPYIFPDDFTVGNTGRISRLVTLLEDVKVAGLITIGAPEYTSNTLAVLREKMSDNILQEQDSSKVKPFPIYTLFPQDDALAIEATSDFVLDKAIIHLDKVEEIEQEQEQVRIDGIEDIIDNAIDNMLLVKAPLKSDSTLFMHVNQIAGVKHGIKRYVDPETGLSSINHFIIDDYYKK